MLCCSAVDRLLGVELNDELFVEIHWNVFAGWVARDHSLQLRRCHLDPLGKPAFRGSIERLNDSSDFPALLDNLDNIPFSDQVGWYVDPSAVDGEVPVADELAGLVSRTSEAHSVDNVIETPLEQHEQIFTRDTAGTVSKGEEAPKLVFKTP